jgi:hypothetical protein
MALKDYEDVRGKVSLIQQRLNADVETIRGNKSYSGHGRTVELAKATLQAQKEAAAIKQN